MASLLSLLNDKENKQLPHYMVLDVETRRSSKDVGGWHNTKDMGISIAVLYDSLDDTYHAYTQDELNDMFEQLLKAQLVIGFNISGFDYGVLQPFASYSLKKLPTLDMLIKVKNTLSYRISLDNLAKATLGIGKNANGLQALTWWKEGRIDDIIKYCKQDVDVTRQIYLYGLEHGYLFFNNKAGKKMRVHVNFKM